MSLKPRKYVLRVISIVSMVVLLTVGGEGAGGIEV